MKRYGIGPYTGIDGLTLTDGPKLVPQYGEVLIKVIASALNRRDILFLQGAYGKANPADRVPLTDGAGEVIAIGEGVTQIKVGDTVISPSMEHWLNGPFDPAYYASGDVGISSDGWLAEEIIRPASALIKIPAGFDPCDAAAMTIACGTAWQILVVFGGLKAGDLVLSQGTGGVTTFAIQIARMFGAQIAVTSSSDEKITAVRELGADICVNYEKTPNWGEEVFRQSGGRGADIIIETGGPASLDQSFAAAAPNARIGLIGKLGGMSDKMPNMFAMLGKNLVLKGFSSASRAMLKDALNAYATNGIKPVIGARYAFDDAQSAYRALDANEVIGKVLIDHR